MDDAAIEAVFRSESGRIIAGLIRVSHSFDLAEEAMQDAFAAAVVSWRTEGVPLNPGAWITATARRKLIDYARREQTRRNNEDQLLYEYEARSGVMEMSGPFEDDRLSLIFTCCHPALNQEAQIALTLRTLGGLTTTEIARAFLVPEATLAQRLAFPTRFRLPAPCPSAFPRCRRFFISSSTKATRPVPETAWCAGSYAPKPSGWRVRCSN
jgi:RNA polymerase sigma-70 factor (ECF subfamily)